MFLLIISVLLGAAAVIFFFVAVASGKDTRAARRGDSSINPRPYLFLVSAIFAALALIFVFLTSIVTVGKDDVGHMTRVYGGREMPAGQIVALSGERGPLATILPPGFKIWPFVNVYYHIEKFPVVEVPAGKYGFIVAQDGTPLRPGQILADKWPEERFQDMLDAEYFLRNGGQRGPQLTVLPPGKYRLNQYLFSIELHDATSVEAGTVGVVKSNVQEQPGLNCSPIKTHMGSDDLSAALVPKGCVGVWNEPLYPGMYYLNARAYEIIAVPNRAQAWEYKGGFVRRYIDLNVDQEGHITQTERSESVPVPQDAADPAVTVRVESWIVPIELRVIAQVAPEDAPFVVAAVGGLTEIEDKILTPTIRSVVRNVVGARGQKVLQLQDDRARLEAEVETAIIPEGRKAGVTIREVRFGDPVIPPELLVTILRQQLATQLEETFRQEQKAQNERVATEKSRATANQQARLVEAQVGVEVERQNKEAAKLRGEGREAELTAVARGQKAQAEVLGEDRVMQLEALKQVLEAAVENPNIVKVPAIMVDGDGDSLAGFAAVLGGASNVAKGSQIFQGEDDEKNKKDKEKK